MATPSPNAIRGAIANVREAATVARLLIARLPAGEREAWRRELVGALQDAAGDVRVRT